MRITRTNLNNALDRFAVAGHGVVIGKPGVGKTFAMKELAARAKESARPCLRLLFDQMGIGDPSDISRAIGVDEDLVALLQSDRTATREKPGYLLLDAFDAARSERGRRRLLHLMRRVINEVGDHWRVLVSVRTYDAQRSSELLDLFPGGGGEPGFTFPSINCRHFWIPELNDEERNEAAASIEGLPAVFAGASQGLKELLRIPFYLWLMEKILSAGGEYGQLGQIASEVGLLEVFWTTRVENGMKADARRALARVAALAMVSRSSLSVPLDEVYDPKHDEAWLDLLSSEVLAKVGRKQDRVAFAHNMLFDYAVSALMIEDSPEALAAFLKEDKARALFLRPSLYYHFAALWQSGLPTFWETYWRMLFDDAVQVRLFATLLPPLVAARELRKTEQLVPLMRRRTKERDNTDRALRRLFQALRVIEAESARRDSAVDSGWLQTVKSLAGDCSDTLSYEVGSWTERAIGRALCDKNDPQMHACGQIARDLFRWIWERRRAPDGERFDSQGSRLMLPLVTRTYSTDAGASRIVLAPLLELPDVKDFPIDYVYRLADEVPNIWPHDPEFAALIYVTVFRHSESSEARTSMGTPVMPITSNRRQDYGMCYYTLKQHFPAFIKACPLVAVRTALQVVEAHVRRQHIGPYQRRPDSAQEAETLRFHGGTAQFVSDASQIWSQGLHHEDAGEIARSLFEFIRKTAEQEANADILDAILVIFRDTARVAFSWSQLLLAGAAQPGTLGVCLHDLLVARPTREHGETVFQLGECLRATYPYLSMGQRKEIETALLALAPTADEEESAFHERRRNRLLGCIPETFVATPEAAKLISELKAVHALPGNEPTVQFSSEWKSFTTGDYLEKRGADIRRPSNIQLREIAERLGSFITDNRNGRPTPEAVSTVLPLLREAWGLLANPADADEPVIRFLWERICEVAATAARGCERPASEEYLLCREILLRGAKDDYPKPNDAADEAYNSPHWSSAPRNEAALGLPWLAVWNKEEDEAVSAVARLAQDPVPSVRFLAVSEAWRLHRYFESQCWEILERSAATERNKVVQRAVCESVARLVPKYEARSVAALSRMQDFMRAAAGGRWPEQFIDIAVWLAFHRENPWAKACLEAFLAAPRAHAKELPRATLQALEFLTPQRLEGGAERAPTERAKAWLSRAIRTAADELRNMFSGDAPCSADLQFVARDLYEVIDHVVTRTYFAAGLFKDSKHHPPVSAEVLKHYFAEMRPLLEEVLAASDAAKGGMLLAPTAHHFMELLNGVLACDPKTVLSMAYRVVKAAQGGAYAFDSMAVKEVVKLVESVFADHRCEARDEDSLEELLGLLDIFVDAGWPEALNLVWRLDEVFK